MAVDWIGPSGRVALNQCICSLPNFISMANGNPPDLQSTSNSTFEMSFPCLDNKCLNGQNSLESKV